jgi:hypothetical protein
MKNNLIMLLLLFTLQAGNCQGVFLYDQQSSDEAVLLEGGNTIQSNQPLGQSFTPALSEVGFIRIYVVDANFQDGLGGTLFLNLRQSSLGGAVLGSTAPVFIPNTSGGFVDFYFSSPIAVTPGQTYFFQPTVVETEATPFMINRGTYNYSGGEAYVLGNANSLYDFWFREGVIVPEPASACLLILALGGFLWTRVAGKSKRLNAGT